jgi:SAM-dependent methyltransferase
MSEKRKCPACDGVDAQVLASLEFGDFDGPSLGLSLDLYCCEGCGQVFNEVPFGPESITAYYESQTLYSAEMGVGSGGSSRFDLERYASALAVLEPHINARDGAIFDVGCAKGGFLQFLKSRGCNNLYGVELSSDCVKYMRDQHRLHAALGSAADIPFDGVQADVVVYSNILEHLYDVKAALAEARRKLKDDGILFVELPDASRYGEYPVFDYYWLSQKEHINHFGLRQLDSLLSSCGFQVLQLGERKLRISDTVENPFIYAIARKGDSVDKPADFALRDTMVRYLVDQAAKMAPRQHRVSELIGRNASVFPWGIGLEFFCLYTLADLRSCDIQCLIDNNPAKQLRTVDGLPIVSGERLAKARPDDVVVITSALHKGVMTDHLRKSGFPGEVVVLT